MNNPKIRLRKTYEPTLQGPRVMTTFQIDKELWTDFRILMAKDNRPAGNMLVELIEGYVKDHKDGNPQYKLEQFKDPNFVACPAVFRDSKAWNHYFSKSNPKELEKAKNQIILIDKALGRYL